MENEILSVSELRDFIVQTLSYAYPQVIVEGEVSGFRVNQGKWVFFDIKDKETTIGCFMTTYQLKTVLEDGMLIRVVATPNLTKWGKFSLTVKAVELAGEGSVKQASDKLKAQFEQEGLFAAERKRILPLYPTRIGLITSEDAAAYHDFVTIAGDRWPLLAIQHAHVHVQGVQAPGDIVGAIQWFSDHYPDLEALVIIRGGGSLEDLQAFNQEDVVRAVYASTIPTVVGIGHEDDVSLAELAADVRASTPTDAARRLVPDQQEVFRLLAELQARQRSQVERRLEQARQLIRGVGRLMQRAQALASLQLNGLHQRLQVATSQRVLDWRHTLALMQRTLAGANPTHILARGYAIARVNGLVLRDPAQVRSTDTVLLQLQAGELPLKPVTAQHDQIDQTSLEFS